MADGRVVFAPCNASSILLFNPLDKSFEDILIPSPVVVEATYLGTRCLEDFLTPNAGRSCCSERLGIAACHLLELLLLSRSIIVCQSTVAASGTRFFSGVEPDAKAILI